MPNFIKHVGQVDATGKKCVVVFREIPEDENSCLVVETEQLMPTYHDSLMEAVESITAQEDMDFYKYANRTVFPDGRNMLEALHLSGWLRKVSTREITMLPTPEIKIKLNELNSQLSQLNNAGKTSSTDINQSSSSNNVQESNSAGTLSDSQIANQMRGQAAFFRQEAERLYKEADALDPQSTKELVTESVAQTPEVRTKRKYTKKK
jgi:hypothetical protein